MYLDFKYKEESPYKPEALDSRSIMPITHVSAHKVMQSLAKFGKTLQVLISPNTNGIIMKLA